MILSKNKTGTKRLLIETLMSNGFGDIELDQCIFTVTALGISHSILQKDSPTNICQDVNLYTETILSKNKTETNIEPFQPVDIISATQITIKVSIY